MQRRATARYKWGFPGSGTDSKSAQSSLGCYFQNADVARCNSAVISKNADVTSLHSVVISKTPTWLDITRLLLLKRRRHQ
jgi:hypothetical protein